MWSRLSYNSTQPELKNRDFVNATARRAQVVRQTDDDDDSGVANDGEEFMQDQHANRNQKSVDPKQLNKSKSSSNASGIKNAPVKASTAGLHMSFTEWLIHEPIAVVVISTLLSLCIQRVSTRIENLMVNPMIMNCSSWDYFKLLQKEKTADDLLSMSTSESDGIDTSNASDARSYQYDYVDEEDVDHEYNVNARVLKDFQNIEADATHIHHYHHYRKSDIAPTVVSSVSTTTGAATVLDLGTTWQFDVFSIVIDLVLNVLLIYIVYRIFVKNGLRPYYGTNR
jgi:hypothetical protein